MKKWFAVGLLAGAIVISALASQAATSWMLGFKGGVSIADLGGEDADSFATDARIGFSGGLFAQANFTRNVGLRFEALYTMRGATDDEAGLDATVKLDYVEFPVLLVVQAPVSDSATLSAFVGPVPAFNMNAEAEVSGVIFGIPVSGSLDIGDEIEDFEFALAMGAGATFDVGTVAIVLDGRYNLGLTSVDGSGNDYDVKNKGFAFMAGVGFPVGAAK